MLKKILLIRADAVVSVVKLPVTFLCGKLPVTYRYVTGKLAVT